MKRTTSEVIEAAMLGDPCTDEELRLCIVSMRQTAIFAHDIPDGWRICGENLYAKHSIAYENLPAWFLVFSVWNEKNVCLSWDETKEWVALLGLKTVPILYDGLWDEMLVRDLYTPCLNGDPVEGYVVRVADEFHYKEFRNVVGKYVRANHVVSHAHWIHNAVEPNGVTGE